MKPFFSFAMVPDMADNNKLRALLAAIFEQGKAMDFTRFLDLRDRKKYVDLLIYYHKWNNINQKNIY